MRYVLLVLVGGLLLAVLWWIAREEPIERRSRDDPQHAESGALPLAAKKGVGEQEGLEEGAEEPPVDKRLILHGLVTGKHGPMWGVKLEARQVGTDIVLREAFTDTDGKYTLELDVPARIDLAALPDSETYLPPKVYPALAFEAGGRERYDFNLIAGAAVSGRVTNGDGTPLPGARVIAVRREVADEDWLHPGELAALPTLTAVSDADGRFRFYGVQSGIYRLYSGERGRMLERPVYFTERSEGFEVVLVPAFALDLEVRNVETRARVEDFEVRLYFGSDTPDLTFRGTGGRLARRFPWREIGAHPFPATALFRYRVVADGFNESRFFYQAAHQSPRTAQKVWLAPPREPNLTFRLRYEDGKPYGGRLACAFRSPDRKVSGSLPLENPAPGTFRGAAPYGEWNVTLHAPDLFRDPRRSFLVDLPAGTVLERTIEFPAGGELIFRRPGGSDGPIAVLVRLSPRGGPPEERAEEVWFKKDARRLGVPPGTYEFGYLFHRKLEKGFSYEVRWFHTAEIGVGSRIEITVPVGDQG